MTDLVQFDPTKDKIALIKRTVAKGATDDELDLFIHICKKTGLDPLARQIYFQKRKNNQTGEYTITATTGIDGFRLIASRSGCYAGSDEPIYDQEDEPKKASVTVYRLVQGIRCAFIATARWDQYYPGDKLGFMWRKMPHLMLGKCAEALALRKAFPAELSGTYSTEEMAQAGPPINVVTPQITEENQEEMYCASDNHKRILMGLASEYNITRENIDYLRSLSEFCIGNSLAKLPDLVKNYVQSHEII